MAFKGFHIKRGARHAVGVSLVAATVFLWTMGSFLSSTIFADNSYSKPYFVTYFNTNTFTIFLVFRALSSLGRKVLKSLSPLGTRPVPTVRTEAQIEESEHLFHSDSSEAAPVRSTPDQDSRSASSSSAKDHLSATAPLTLRETMQLSLQFCLLWFTANFFQSASLEYTSVASSTILSTTSGVWTLAFGAWLKVENFTIRKALGVLASLAGVAIIAFGDVSGESDEHRGSFPHKSPGEIALGDTMALASAALYGLYTTLLKKRIHDESRIDVLLFLGFVGLANTILVWPGLIVLHVTGWERWEMPPTQRIWGIVLAYAAMSVLGDITWAYAVLFTSPLVVTIGLSLSIPLSIVGQLILNAQSATISYWFGAVIVLGAFIFINKESQAEELASEERRREE